MEVNHRNIRTIKLTKVNRKLSYLTLVSLSFIFGCNNPAKKSEEAAKPETYTNKEVGWSITIPTGFQTISKTRMDANQERWEKEMGTKAEKSDTGGIKKLINFQKNQFNSLFATADKYDPSKEDSYLSMNRELRKMIYDTYVKQKIKVDTISGTEMIGDKKFQTFNLKLYGPNGDMLLNQLIYTQLVNGYDFNVSINYNNEADKETLVNAFKNSKFVN